MHPPCKRKVASSTLADSASIARSRIVLYGARLGAKVKGLLKAELARKDISYKELVEKLAALGISETPENIANKISRGKFTAIFLIQCLVAIGCTTIHLE